LKWLIQQNPSVTHKNTHYTITQAEFPKLERMNKTDYLYPSDKTNLCRARGVSGLRGRTPLHSKSKRIGLLLLLLELRTERRLLLLPAPRAEPKRVGIRLLLLRAEPKRVGLRLLLLLRGRVHEPTLRSVLAAATSRT